MFFIIFSERTQFDENCFEKTQNLRHCHKEKIVKLQQRKKEKKILKMKFAVLFFIGSTVTSLTLDERMDWAAQDPKGMYSNNKISSFVSI